jgi:TonB family protein
MRALSLVVFAAAVAAGAPAFAAGMPLAVLNAPPLPTAALVEGLSTQRSSPVVITQPDWQRQPSAEDLARLYPAAAAQAGKNGRATIRCRVKGDGTLEACVIASETPRGLMFGEQALKLAPLYKMPPQAKGEPVAGKLVNVPIQFRLS